MSHSIVKATTGVAATRLQNQTAADDIDNKEHPAGVPSLLPGVPDHIAQLCLAHVPPSLLSAVCRPWRHLIYSPSFPPFPSLYALFISSAPSNYVQFSSFDPISRRWIPLPPPPSDPPLRFIFRHPSFISRKLPIQSVSVAGHLVVLAATDERFMPALSKPLIFNPTLQNWTYGPQFSFPRRWCAAGTSGGAVFLASGIGSHYSTDVARSVEKLYLNEFGADRRQGWRWERMGNLKDGKFSRDAIDAVGWRGKLCMVNVKGDAAKEGIIYDAGADRWVDMPEGMLAGWRGPAAAMDEETIYAVDESRCTLRRYDHVRDAWEDLVESGVLRGAQHVAAARGKVCVVCGDGVTIAVVDVAAAEAARLWTVNVPDRFEAVAVHVLPRLNRPALQFK